MSNSFFFCTVVHPRNNAGVRHRPGFALVVSGNVGFRVV